MIKAPVVQQYDTRYCSLGRDARQARRDHALIDTAYISGMYLVVLDMNPPSHHALYSKLFCVRNHDRSAHLPVSDVRRTTAACGRHHVSSGDAHTRTLQQQQQQQQPLFHVAYFNIVLSC